MKKLSSANFLRKLTQYFLILVGSTGILVHPAQATPRHGFYFFGDSLSDSGYQNNNPLVKKLGKTPIWTSPHGHTWIYYFLQNYARCDPQANTQLKPNNTDAKQLFHPVPTHIDPILDGNNFAAGGSTTKGTGILNTNLYKSPSLLEQVDYFTKQYAPEHAVNIANNTYFIWSGSNDLMKTLVLKLWIAGWLQKTHLATLAAWLGFFDEHQLPKQFVHTQAHVATHLQEAVIALEQAGAKKIIVLLLPDIGATPLIQSLVQGLNKQYPNTLSSRQLAAAMQTVTYQTNALIRQKLASTHAMLIDINRIMHPLTTLKTPCYFQETRSQFGKASRFLVVNNTVGACTAKQQALTCIPSTPNAAHYVFEDLVHPTAQTHQIIGDYVYYQTLRLNNAPTGAVSGNIPCQIKNASAACSTNIPKPSTAKHPRAVAHCTKAVGSNKAYDKS